MSASMGTEFTGASAAEAARRLDVFDRMAADRQRLRFLLDRLRHGQADGPAAARLFDQLCDALEGYGAASEQSLYAEILVRAETDDKWPARHAVAVHDMADLLTFELSVMDKGGDGWQAGLRQLSAYLEDHFTLEAEEIVPLARMLFSGEEAARLGDKYERLKRDFGDRFGRATAANRPSAQAPAPAKAAQHAQLSARTATAARPHGTPPPFVV